MLNSLSRQSIKVLVVDDEPAVSEIICRVLRREGYSCGVASSTAEARSYLKKHAVDLITLDVDMPGQTGIEWLPNLHQEFPDIAVIMLTAVGAMDLAVGALTSGASDFLTKPFKFTELIKCVRRVIERRALTLQRNCYTQQLEDNIRRQDASIRSTDEQTIRLLVQASLYRDEETGSHIRRVGSGSAVLAEAMGWSKEDVIRMRLAAPLHDVGKIGVPDCILKKPGKLTPDELALMKSHVAIGDSLLATCDSPTLKLAREIARNHHERWDGNGYLQGLSGTAIPQSARIVAVVDVYDALTHDRVYRPAFSEQQALEMILASRKLQFDPEIVDAIFDVLPAIREADLAYVDLPSDANTPLKTLVDCNTNLMNTINPLGVSDVSNSNLLNA